MITNQLLRPASIVVVGASNNVHKPGGAILRNLINGGYTGELRAVNPKETEVQGVTAYADVKDIPDTELAILAIPAQMCPDAVEVLAAEKQVRAFIILSAGFGEETHEGALLEDRILETVNKYDASLIGPNCIGLMNTWHHSVFSQPIPQLHPQGVDLISSSGATAVFILESAVTKGLQFNSVWSVGNAKQIGVEDVLQYMDENFQADKDSNKAMEYAKEHSADKPASAFSFDWILFLGLLAGIALCTLIISYLSKRPKEQTMHYALNTFNLALVIVVTALSIQPKPNQLNKMEEPTMKQDNKLSVLDNIHARTSIRSYQPKEVEDEKIEQLLRAAMAAPTATNRQPWAFIVIRDKETMNELGSTLPYAKMVKDAPLAIAVCGDLTKAISGAGIEYWVQDASAASENLLLAAQALGLGAVWTGVYPIDERVKEVQKILQLPEQIVPLNVIPIGYPAENPLPKDKWKPENVHYDRWTEPDKK